MGTERETVTMDVTVQERQLIEDLRQWGKVNYRLQIEIVDGVWDVAVRELGTKRAARGTGATFDDAWDGMAPLWA